MISTNKTAINPFDSQACIYAHPNEYIWNVESGESKMAGKRKEKGQENNSEREIAKKKNWLMRMQEINMNLIFEKFIVLVKTIFFLAILGSFSVMAAWING